MAKSKLIMYRKRDDKHCLDCDRPIAYSIYGAAQTGDYCMEYKAGRSKT